MRRTQFARTGVAEVDVHVAVVTGSFGSSHSDDAVVRQVGDDAKHGLSQVCMDAQ
jgi:hypothetical protein